MIRPMQRIFQRAGFVGKSVCNFDPSLRICSQRTFAITSAAFDSDRLYTKKHEWISLNGKVGTVGVSRFAQEALGDVVYVETPDAGRKLERGETVGAVESVKAASDLYAPVSGTVVEKNSELDAKPFLINKSTYDNGWLYKMELDDEAELKELMDEGSYETFCKEEQESEH